MDSRPWCRSPACDLSLPARSRRVRESLASVERNEVRVPCQSSFCQLRSTAPRRGAAHEFVAKAENIVFVGPTGVGKTGLASGLLLKALQNGHRGLFIRAQDLFDEMYASLADRSSRKLINRLARVDLLVVDEMGYLNLKPEQTNIFFKLMEERYRRKATIITTNLKYDEWHNFLGNKPLVDALLSRLRHQCHTVEIDGPSLRDPQKT
jgi:DNA replication protein DnaC